MTTFHTIFSFITFQNNPSIPFRAFDQQIHPVVIWKMKTCSSNVHVLTHMHVVTLLSMGFF